MYRTYLAVDTKSLSSPPCSSNCSRVLASPVDCSPITTHWRKNPCQLSFLIHHKNIHVLVVRVGVRVCLLFRFSWFDAFHINVFSISVSVWNFHINVFSISVSVWNFHINVFSISVSVWNFHINVFSISVSVWNMSTSNKTPMQSCQNFKISITYSVKVLSNQTKFSHQNKCNFYSKENKINTMPFSHD
jgi:hypothetical protein